MTARLRIAFFGSSLVSAYWNGAATYYRGIIRALAARSYDVTFYEPDAYDRQAHRDIDDPAWAKVVVYPAREDGVLAALEGALGADLIVKTSGVGVFDEWLERAVPDLAGGRTQIAFWDVDAPATLDRLDANPVDPFRAQIPRYDIVFTYGGGEAVVRGYLAHGAQQCVPVYNALDPDTHFRVPPEDRFACTLGFLGNRMPDREARVEEFFFRPAARLSGTRFLLGGNGWGSRALPSNVLWAGHVYTRDHNAFNSTPQAVLNVNRDSMARFGFSPPTRVFEAAGAGACLITDAWQGIDQFLEPEREVLVAHDGDEVVAHLSALTPERAREIGTRARARILAEHTYQRRADQLDSIFTCASRS